MLTIVKDIIFFLVYASFHALAKMELQETLWQLKSPLFL